MSLDIISLLADGDKRTVNHVDEVVRAVAAKPGLVGVLISCLDEADKGLAMRAADALQKLGAEEAGLLETYKPQLLHAALSNKQKEVQWHMAQILPVLDLTDGEASRLTKAWEENFYNSNSSIVKTFSMQAVADISAVHPSLTDTLNQMIAFALENGTPAMRSRAKKLAGL